jgi:hypothetical protein
MRLLANLRSNQTDEDLLRQTTALTTAYLLERNRKYEAWLRRKIAQLEDYVTAQEMHERELAGELGSAAETASDEAGASGWEWASSLDDMVAAGGDEPVSVEASRSTIPSESVSDHLEGRDVAGAVTETMPTQSVEPAESDTAQEDYEASSSDNDMDEAARMDWQGWLLSGSETAPAMATDTSLEAVEVEAVDEPELEAKSTTKLSDPIEVVEISETPNGSEVMEQDLDADAIPDDADQSKALPVVTVPPAEAELPAPGQAPEMELIEARGEPVEYFSLDALPELADTLEPIGDDDSVTKTGAVEIDPDSSVGIDPAEMSAGQPATEAKLDPWESDLDYEGGLSEHL